MVKEDIRVAICFWGLTRSLQYTLPSIKKFIFKPLNDANIEYDIFLHTYTLNHEYSNPRAKEYNIRLDNDLFKLLEPKEYILDDQDDIDKKINLNKYTSMGNPWDYDNSPIHTLHNVVRALWSLKQVTTLWLKNKALYTHVMYCRPDVTYIMPFNVKWLSDTNDVYTPDFANVHKFKEVNKREDSDVGVNDRFGFGRPDQMEVYGNRFDEALSYSKKHKLHSETFLEDVLNKHHIGIKYIKFGFIRTRANGDMDSSSSDIPQLVKKKWYTRKRARDTQAIYTRKANRLSIVKS